MPNAGGGRLEKILDCAEIAVERARESCAVDLEGAVILEIDANGAKIGDRSGADRIYSVE